MMKANTKAKAGLAGRRQSSAAGTPVGSSCLRNFLLALGRRCLLPGLLLASGEVWASQLPPPGALSPDSAGVAAVPLARHQALPPGLTAPVRRAVPPDPARLRELRSQRDFHYAERPAEQSAWDLLMARFWRWLMRQLGSLSYARFWRWVLYGVFIAAGAFIVLKLLGINFTGLLNRSARRAPLAYDTAGENIHEVDFAARLAEAEAAGNFRLAVRLGYLQLLKQLTDQGFIDWQLNKTNHAYLGELPPTGPLRSDFREIIRQFEYVWYGELSLSLALYERVRAGHHHFTRQLAGAARQPA